jgi:hypothetical protein
MSTDQARDIASKFVLKHKATFTLANQEEIRAAVDKVARAIRSVHLASERAKRSRRSNSSTVET